MFTISEFSKKKKSGLLASLLKIKRSGHTRPQFPHRTVNRNQVMAVPLGQDIHFAVCHTSFCPSLCVSASWSALFTHLGTPRPQLDPLSGALHSPIPSQDLPVFGTAIPNTCVLPRVSPSRISLTPAVSSRRAEEVGEGCVFVFTEGS